MFKLKRKLLCLVFSCMLTLSGLDCSNSIAPEILSSQTIDLSDIAETRINGQELSAQAKGTTDMKFNLGSEEHVFTIYRLPTTNRAGNAQGQYKLKLNLDSYTMSDLASKSFFFILSNTETVDSGPLTTISSVLPIGRDTHTAAPLVDVSGLLKNTAASTNGYEDFESAVEGTTTRTFLFQQSSENDVTKKYSLSPALLYKKIEHKIHGKMIRIAIWVDSTGKDTATSTDDALQTSDVRTKQALDFFEADFFTSTDAIYNAIYALNNDNHFWDEHSNSDIAEGDSVLHIGIGDLASSPDNTSGSTLGYISREHFFKERKIMGVNAVKEEIIAPTMYISVELINKFKDFDISLPTNKKALYDFYSTFAHEFQHIATFYLRNVRVINNSNGYEVVNMGAPWFYEFIAVATENILMKAMLTKLMPDDNVERIREEMLTITTDPSSIRNPSTGLKSLAFQNFNHSIFSIKPIATTDTGIDAIQYQLLHIFSTYLFNNYGLDVMANIMTNNSQEDFKIDGKAMFEAVTDENIFYQKLSEDVRPQSFEQLFNDFHTAIFISEVPIPYSETGADSDPWITSGPYKMFTYNHPNLSIVKLNGTEAMATVTDIPMSSNLKASFNNYGEYVNYNLAFSPYDPNDNSVRDKTYTSIAQNSNIINLSEFWFKQAGPVLVTTNTMAERDLKAGLANNIYLGGKINALDSEVGANINFKTDKVNNKEILSIELLMPNEYMGSLVVVEFP